MPDKSKLPKYKRDKSGNPVVFDVVSLRNGEIVASSASRVRARNIAKELEPGDGEQYAVRIRALTLPAEDQTNPALRTFEETLRNFGAGLFVRCLETHTRIIFELWRTIDRQPIVLLVYPDERFEAFLAAGSSSDLNALNTTLIRQFGS